MALSLVATCTAVSFRWRVANPIRLLVLLGGGVLTAACSQTTPGKDGAAHMGGEVGDASPETGMDVVPVRDGPDDDSGAREIGETMAPDDAIDRPAADGGTADAGRDGADDVPADGAADSASGPCGGAPCVVGSNWAQWPMPNTMADAANGAPHAAKLVDNGDDTVTDAITGLMWQRSATVTKYLRSDAQAHCNRLRTGGHDDWRAPSAIELSSIIDFDHFTSSIDASVFPDSPIDQGQFMDPAAQFGTTSVARTTPPSGWLIDFAFGGVSLDTTANDRPAFTRCVRGAAAPADDTSAGRYDLSESGIARDIKTGLAWQRGVAVASRKLADAKAYCATGTSLSGQGWRLPTMKELLTLVDFAKPDPGLDATVFTVPTDIVDPYGVLWSATKVLGKPPYSQFTNGEWTLYLHFGANWYIDTDIDYAFVRCVR